MNTSISYGSYYNEFPKNRNCAQFRPHIIDDNFQSLSLKIDDNFYELHSCETLSTTVKSIHSIIHKISECLSKNYVGLAVSTFADLNAYFDPYPSCEPSNYSGHFNQIEIK